MGGSTRAPIMTAYRQQALACASVLSKGPQRVRDLRTRIPDAGKILLHNVYGWFDRAERGVYVLTEAGRAALKRRPQYAAMSVLPSFESADAWLGCHINFVLQCNMTLTRYPGSKEGPHESRLDYQIWTSARKALDAQSTRPSLWWASPGLSSHT